MITIKRSLLLVYAISLLLVGVGVAQQVVISPSVSEPEQTAFTVDIDIDTGGLEVAGVAMLVTFDPATVRLDGIEPGAWLTALGDEGTAYFFHDYTPQAPAGELRLDAAVLGSTATGSGQLAICHFTALAPGESPLTFIEVDVRGPENQDLGFGHSTGDLIRINTGQVYFDPSTSTPVTTDFTVDLAIAAAGYQVKGAEIIVDFDPAVVGLTDITPGDWVTDQGLLYYFYDYTVPGTHEIHLAMSFLDGSGTGSGVLAVCHFTALAVGISPLEFVTVTIRDPDNQPLIFTNSVGDRIIVDPVIESDRTSYSDIKASFR